MVEAVHRYEHGTESKTKNDFEKEFFKLMNNPVFRKTMENVRKHRDIRLVTTDRRRNHQASKPNYYATKWFSKNLLAIEINKTEVKMSLFRSLGSKHQQNSDA